MKRALLILPIMLILSGCLSSDQRVGAGPTISNVPSKEDLSSTADGLRKDITNKQDAIQTNLSSLIGASIGKLSDELVHVSDLLHAEIGSINNQMTASLASGNELRLMLKNQMSLNAKLQADLTASIKANAQLQAMMDAKIQGIAGIAGKIDQTTNDMKQNLQAGHDVNNITQQFTKEVLASIESANHTNAWNTTVSNLIVLGVVVALFAAACIIVCVVFRNSRNAALLMVQQKDMELKEKSAKLERAMGMMTPDVADRLMHFPKSGQ